MAKRCKPPGDERLKPQKRSKPPELPNDAAFRAALEADLRRHDAGAAAAAPGKRDRSARIGYGQKGTLRLRGDAWRVQFRSEPDDSGRRKQHSIRVGFLEDMTREQALAAAALIMAHVSPRRIVPGTSCSWESWCDRFIEVYLVLQRSSSQQSTGSVIRCHLRPAFAGLQLHEVRISRIQSRIATWRAQGVAPATIITRYRILRRMLARAKREGLAAEVPGGADVDLPRSEAVETPRSKAFTTEELGKILGAAAQPWRTLYMVMAFCALRISEALGLKWADLDLAAGRMNIVRQAQAGREVAPKTRASVAVRRIPPRLVEHLREFGAGRHGDDGFLFPSPQGGPLHASGVRTNHLGPLLKRLGIHGRSAHGFRHWHGHTAATSGVAVPTLQKALRHRDPRSTQVYLNVTTADVDAAVEAVEVAYLRNGGELLSTPEKRNGAESPNLQ